MRFTQGRRRPAPSVIIVSLIDVLLVVLIFLMVSTTFRQTPAVKLALPESKQSETQGASPNQVLVTIAKADPPLYLNQRPVTFDELPAQLGALAAANTNLAVSIRADRGATVEQVIRVMDAARGAGIRAIDMVTQSPGGK